MTTICAKAGIMCSDGYVIYGQGFLAKDTQTKVLTPEPGEKWYILGKRVIGFGAAGTLSVVEIAKDLLRKGIYHDTKTYHTFGAASILAITEDIDLFTIYIEADAPIELHYEQGGIGVLGIGGQIAKAYMCSGKSSKEAVKFLLKTNVLLGGTVTEINFNEFKEELAKKEAELPKDFVFVPKFQALTPKPEPKKEEVK